MRASAMMRTDTSKTIRARRALLIASSLGALALAFPSACGREEEPRPDIVLLVIDTLRADRLSCYGYPRPTSPNLDALAAEGTLFEYATAQASWTLVSMTSLWAGRYVTDFVESPDPSWPVLAETFQRAGYRTIGRSGNPLLQEGTSFARGFDDYACFGVKGPRGGYPSADRLVADVWEPLDRALVKDARGQRKPILLYLQPYDPHAPYKHHAEFEAELPLAGAPRLEPEGWHREKLERFGPPAPADDPGWARAFDHLHRMRGEYEQEIRFLDRQIGILLAGLRERGVLDNALIAIVADHGEGLWDHLTPLPPEKLAEYPPEHIFYGGHGYTLFQESIHTPFILWGAGVPRGKRVSEPVENVDLFPTLLELTGLAPPTRLHGRSLVDLMRGEHGEWRRYVFAAVRHIASVHDLQTGLKLVEPTGLGKRKEIEPQLFHLPSDPRELRDLAAERPAEVERLSAILADWRRAHPVGVTKGERRTPEQIELMRGLGYTEDHSPGLEGESDEIEKP